MLPGLATPSILPPLAAVQRTSVGVIGAGVVGLSSALWLQKAGHRVTLADPAPPVAGGSYEQASSFGNACTMAFGACIPVASPGILRALPRMLLDRHGPLSINWSDLTGLMPWLASFLRAASPVAVSRIAGVLGSLLRLAEAGQAPLFEDARATHLKRPTGCLYLYRSARSFARAQPEIALRRREGVRMRILEQDEVRAREPNLAPLYHKGLLFEDAYSIDNPLAYAQQLLRCFIDRGGEVVTARVRTIDRGTDGLTIRCEDRSIRSDHAVLAAGAWSGGIARSFGDHIRLSTERGYHVMFPGEGGLLSAPTCYPEHGFYMTPLGEGLRAAGTVELGGLDKPAREERTQVIERVTRELLPCIGKAGRTWLGFRPSMPDSLPVIGRSPSDARIIHAFGHGHIGLTLAGITGRLVADMIGGQPPLVDLTPLRADRF
ncbi:NAD(P)/FAD-dependent oxidoreductase [Aureimonas populi]|uniref:NAD(P)/FAD-dependent oxidoreductase n=1 Tax=Aureimonas populi TaxID=1701758 RepID=A0ABW5CQR6_9HYPH|nr:FAD-dependent oxidoreductase [Aureimonas populi]